MVAALAAWGRRDVNWAMCCKNLLISATENDFGRGHCADVSTPTLHQHLILPSAVCEAIPPVAIRGKSSKNTLIHIAVAATRPSISALTTANGRRGTSEQGLLSSR